MENLKKEIKRGIDFHIKDSLTSSDILKGDLIVFESLFNKRLKTKEEYEDLFDYFKEIILNELDNVEFILKDNKNLNVDNEIDQQIIKVINTIDINLVVSELLRLNSGKKKMIRANMVYKSYDANDIYLAALIELFHLATLIQDDVIDNANYRRFKETINNKYSNKIAIIISDVLIVKVVLEIKSYLENKIKNKDDFYIKYFEKEIYNLVTNLIFSEKYAKKISNLKEYKKYAIYKTANLFSFGISTSYISASYPNVNEDKLEELKLFSNEFGIIFQKIDDLIDYKNDFSISGKDSVDKINGINNYIYLMLEKHDIGQIVKLLKDDLVNLERFSCSKYFKEELKMMREKLYE